MSYILGSIAVLVVLHIYYRIGRVYQDQEALREKCEAMDEVLSRIVWDNDNGAHFPGNITARSTMAVEDAREAQPVTIGQYKSKWRVIGNTTSNDNGGNA